MGTFQDMTFSISNEFLECDNSLDCVTLPTHYGLGGNIQIVLNNRAEVSDAKRESSPIFEQGCVSFDADGHTNLHNKVYRTMQLKLNNA